MTAAELECWAVIQRALVMQARAIERLLVEYERRNTSPGVQAADRARQRERQAAPDEIKTVAQT
jgi:hypothetical protein